jgi:hypothetical protein
LNIVYAWLRGVVSLYYRYWKEQYFNKSKEQLTTAVVDLEPRVVKFTTVRNRQGVQNVVDDDDDMDRNTIFCPLRDTAQFNVFTGFYWTVWRGRPPGNLTVTSFKEIKVCQRKGSLLSFPPQPKSAIIKPSPKAAPKPASIATPTTAAAASSGRSRNSDVVIKSDPDECSLLDDDVPCAVGSSSSVHGGGSQSSSPRKQRAKRRRANDDDGDDERDAELLEEVLRQDEWKKNKRELENKIRRLQLKVDRLENDEKQLTLKLEQSERARKNEQATTSPRQAKDLLARVERLQAEKEEESQRHVAAVAELNRQVEHQKEAKRKQAALHAKTFVDNAQLRKQIVQLQEENRKLQEAALATATNHQAILASTMATANALRDELALVKQNSVTQDEQFDDDVDDDNSDSV